MNFYGASGYTGMYKQAVIGSIITAGASAGVKAGASAGIKAGLKSSIKSGLKATGNSVKSVAGGALSRSGITPLVTRGNKMMASGYRGLQAGGHSGLRTNLGRYNRLLHKGGFPLMVGGVGLGVGGQFVDGPLGTAMSATSMSLVPGFTAIGAPVGMGTQAINGHRALSEGGEDEAKKIAEESSMRAAADFMAVHMGGGGTGITAAELANDRLGNTDAFGHYYTGAQQPKPGKISNIWNYLRGGEAQSEVVRARARKRIRQRLNLDLNELLNKSSSMYKQAFLNKLIGAGVSAGIKSTAKKAPGKIFHKGWQGPAISAGAVSIPVAIAASGDNLTGATKGIVEDEAYAGSMAAIQKRMDGMNWIERAAFKLDPSVAVSKFEAEMPGFTDYYRQNYDPNYQTSTLGHLTNSNSTPGWIAQNTDGTSTRI